jgi:hypothetical protein
MCGRAPRLRLVGKNQAYRALCRVRVGVGSLDQAKNDSRRVLYSVKEINGMFDCGEIEWRF